jgi:hypothetical protein
MASTLPDEETQRLLKEVVTHFDKEDTAARERQIRTARRLKLFWEGFHRAWYSEVAHDWRIWDEAEGDDTNQADYDKPVNVFRAYLESIIAALSITVPPIKCYPDDADDTLDLSTAKAGDKIAQLVYRHNNVPLLWLHALFIYMTEGMVACYSYPKSKDEYGTYEEKNYEEILEARQTASCPHCGYTVSDESLLEPPIPSQPIPQEAAGISGTTPPMGQGMGVPPEMGGIPPQNPQMEGMQQEPIGLEDEFQPEEYDICPACGELYSPLMEQKEFIVTRLVGTTVKAKSRMCLEAYGMLYIKVPNYAKKQEDCPYLIYSYETHYANAIERYEHLHSKKKEFTQKIKASTGPQDPYEQWGRLSPQYQGEYPLNTVTCRNVWLRPCAFNVLQEDEAKGLKKKYPNGVKVVLINDCFGEACPEVLDDYWTLTYNPLADYIVHDPIGLLLVSIQEITNDLLSLTLQTIEHGIGQVFADPGVLDFPAYRQLETVPGGVYEAKPKSGSSLNDAFKEIKTANLSPEVMPFAQNIQSLAQLVSGALPSLFGGAIEGSETASQYSMSRAQALQRLQNTWKIFTHWWKEIFGKVIPMFIKEVQTDEKDVQRDDNGNFINVFIRKAELEGKIGKVELEANENLPLTWNQQKDVIMQLLQNANPQILEILGSPENLSVIRDAIGLTDFYVPGEDSRNKQYDEIKLLLNSEPIPTGDPNMPEQPSVEVDEIYDVHPIEFEIVRKWATSEEGRQAKIDNEAGYRNVLLHGKMHYMMQQQQSMMAPPEEGGGPPEEKPPENTEVPIQGEENVQTV